MFIISVAAVDKNIGKYKEQALFVHSFLKTLRLPVHQIIRLSDLFLNLLKSAVLVIRFIFVWKLPD